MKSFKMAFVFIFFLLINKKAISQNEFITEWVPLYGSITIPTSAIITMFGETAPFVYNYDIEWINKRTGVSLGSTINQTGDFTIYPSSADTIIVKISGVFPHFYMNIHNDRDKLVAVTQWGNIEWKSFVASFYGCHNLKTVPNHGLDLRTVENMTNMFNSCNSFNADLTAWDVSNVRVMSQMFSYATAFNGDISTWDMSNLITTDIMFYNATSFNGDLSSWNMSNIINTSNMFNGATSFNADLSSWDISGVEYCDRMFERSGMSYCNMDATLNAWAPILLSKSYNIGQIPVASINSATVRAGLGGRVSLANPEITNPITNAITINTSSATCMGEQVSFTATSTYTSTYKWDNGVVGNVNSFNLTNDTIITVIAFDTLNCKSYDTLFVTANALPMVNLTSDAINDEACLNTIVEFTANGAATYEWNGIADAATISFILPSDTTVIVKGFDGNGCSAFDTLAITALALPTVALTSDAVNNAACLNSVVEFMANGAATYEWNGIADAATISFILPSDTTMIVKGIDVNGCSAFDTLAITTLALPMVSLTSDAVNDEVCTNTTVTFTATGGNTYEWNGVADAASVSFAVPFDTTMIVKGINADGCSAFDTLAITTLALPTVSIAADSTTICKGDAANLTVSGADTYVWSTQATDEDIMVTPAATATFTVTGTDANGCENTASVEITVEECVGLEENQISFSVYPNPATEYVTIRTEHIDLSKASLVLMNVTGKVLVHTLLTENTSMISLAHYSAGVYFIKVQVGNLVNVQKIVKR